MWGASPKRSVLAKFGKGSSRKSRQQQGIYKVRACLRGRDESKAGRGETPLVVAGLSRGLEMI